MTHLNPVHPPGPVIASSNRASDIEPYCGRIYNAEPKKWGDILPWEFPQNATKNEEEEFLRQFFTDDEIHMQGGAHGDGAGFRFLKQVWYCIALWNLKWRIPAIAEKWFQDNSKLLTPDMVQYCTRDDCELKTFFEDDNVEIYGKKLLHWAMKIIQVKVKEMFPPLAPVEEEVKDAEQTAGAPVQTAPQEVRVDEAGPAQPKQVPTANKLGSLSTHNTPQTAPSIPASEVVPAHESSQPLSRTVSLSDQAAPFPEHVHAPSSGRPRGNSMGNKQFRNHNGSMRMHNKQPYNTEYNPGYQQTPPFHAATPHFQPSHPQSGPMRMMSGGTPDFVQMPPQHQRHQLYGPHQPSPRTFSNSLAPQYGATMMPPPLGMMPLGQSPQPGYFPQPMPQANPYHHPGVFSDRGNERFGHREFSNDSAYYENGQSHAKRGGYHGESNSYRGGKTRGYNNNGRGRRGSRGGRDSFSSSRPAAFGGENQSIGDRRMSSTDFKNNMRIMSNDHDAGSGRPFGRNDRRPSMANERDNWHTDSDRLQAQQGGNGMHMQDVVASQGHRPLPVYAQTDTWVPMQAHGYKSKQYDLDFRDRSRSDAHQQPGRQSIDLSSVPFIHSDNDPRAQMYPERVLTESSLGSDCTHVRKLIVFHVPRGTPIMALRHSFSQFGELEDLSINDAGYVVWVTFKSHLSVRTALQQQQHLSFQGQGIRAAVPMEYWQPSHKNYPGLGYSHQQAGWSGGKVPDMKQNSIQTRGQGRPGEDASGETAPSALNEARDGRGDNQQYGVSASGSTPMIMKKVRDGKGKVSQHDRSSESSTPVAKGPHKDLQDPARQHSDDTTPTPSGTATPKKKKPKKSKGGSKQQQSGEDKPDLPFESINAALTDYGRQASNAKDAGAQTDGRGSNAAETVLPAHVESDTASKIISEMSPAPGARHNINSDNTAGPVPVVDQKNGGSTSAKAPSLPPAGNDMTAPMRTSPPSTSTAALESVESLQPSADISLILDTQRKASATSDRADDVQTKSATPLSPEMPKTQLPKVAIPSVLKDPTPERVESFRGAAAEKTKTADSQEREVTDLTVSEGALQDNCTEPKSPSKEVKHSEAALLQPPQQSPEKTLDDHADDSFHTARDSPASQSNQTIEKDRIEEESQVTDRGSHAGIGSATPKTTNTPREAPRETTVLPKSYAHTAKQVDNMATSASSSPDNAVEDTQQAPIIPDRARVSILLPPTHDSIKPTEAGLRSNSGTSTVPPTPAFVTAPTTPAVPADSPIPKDKTESVTASKKAVKMDQVEKAKGPAQTESLMGGLFSKKEKAKKKKAVKGKKEPASRTPSGAFSGTATPSVDGDDKPAFSITAQAAEKMATVAKQQKNSGIDAKAYISAPAKQMPKEEPSTTEPATSKPAETSTKPRSSFGDLMGAGARAVEAVGNLFSSSQPSHATTPEVKPIGSPPPEKALTNTKPHSTADNVAATAPQQVDDKAKKVGAEAEKMLVESNTPTASAATSTSLPGPDSQPFQPFQHSHNNAGIRDSGDSGGGSADGDDDAVGLGIDTAPDSLVVNDDGKPKKKKKKAAGKKKRARQSDADEVGSEQDQIAGDVLAQDLSFEFAANKAPSVTETPEAPTADDVPTRDLSHEFQANNAPSVNETPETTSEGGSSHTVGRSATESRELTPISTMPTRDLSFEFQANNAPSVTETPDGTSEGNSSHTPGRSATSSRELTPTSTTRFTQGSSPSTMIRVIKAKDTHLVTAPAPRRSPSLRKRRSKSDQDTTPSENDTLTENEIAAEDAGDIFGHVLGAARANRQKPLLYLYLGPSNRGEDAEKWQELERMNRGEVNEKTIGESARRRLGKGNDENDPPSGGKKKPETAGKDA